VRRKELIFLLFTTTVIALSLSAIRPAKAQNPDYYFNKEWAKVYINEDGSIDLLYNITITCIRLSIGYVTVGMPAPNFHIGYVKDFPSGATLNYEDKSRGSYYGIEVALKQRISEGQSATFTLLANVPQMIYEDTYNPGNVGLQFVPCWFDRRVENLRVLIVLPSGVKESEIKTPKGLDWDNLLTEDGNYVVYWERESVPANYKFDDPPFGVSIPQKYVPGFKKAEPGWSLPAWLLPLGGTIIIMAAVVMIVRSRVKLNYARPRIMAEALGPARGLTAVEAAVVLNLSPLRVLTMILFSLLLKRAIRVTEVEPLIKVEVSRGAPQKPQLKYYELDFMKAVSADGTLDEKTLARTYLSLKGDVDQKMRGFSHEDTVNYYKSIVDKAWAQVNAAGTPELKGDALEQQLDWLLLDEKYKERMEQTFPPDVIILPRPDWWWYWHGPHIPPKGPATARGPTVPSEAKPIPGADFANKVVTAIEQSSNRLVKNAESFVNKILPAPPVQSREPVHHRASCACACASCACACACVSCACACAGGGAR